MAAGEQARGEWKAFRGGLAAGLLFGVLGLALGVYVLNMLGLVVVSFSRVPGVQDFLYWAYANLRLSVVPFTAIAALYTHQLRRLHALAGDSATPPEQLDRAERWVDISATLFFGVGVVWTAIGMRSALLSALGGLDQSAAAELGAFEILRRLVDGGILLALSTTIVGAVGGYLMRLGKTVVAGERLEAFHNRLAEEAAARFERRLAAIELHLSHIAGETAGAAAAERLRERGPERREQR